MADYQEYQIWALHLDEALGSTRSLLVTPDDWKPQLKGLWYHPDAQELSAYDASERVKQGYLERLTATTPAFRGPENDRSRLYPSCFSTQTNGTLEDACLSGVKATNCHLVLNLGHVYLKVSFLSPNATVQLYWPDSWAAVKNTPRYKYGDSPEQRMLIFSVALALDFGDFVISFNGPDDLLFACEWSLHCEIEPEQPRIIDMLNDWEGYMQRVVRWLEDDYSSMTVEEKRTCIATFLSQNSGERDIFAGIKFHSRSEVLHRAGISPNLTLREVVEMRSRFYRLLLATWQYKSLSYYIWHTYVRIAVHDRLLAPTFDNRLDYIMKPHLAYGKYPITVSRRLEAQIQEFNEASESLDPDVRLSSCDAFDPSLIEDAIRHAPEFCPAILGEAFWGLHQSQIAEQPWSNNPLVEKDKREGLFLCDDDLVPSASWTELFVPQNLRRIARIPNFMYSSNTLGEIWTPLQLPDYADLQGDASGSSCTRMITIEDKYAVGALESPGNAIAIRSTSQRAQRSNPPFFTYPSRGAATEDDPSTYRLMRVNVIATLSRLRQANLKREHRGKVTLSEEERSARERAYAAFDEMWIDRFGSLPDPSPDALTSQKVTRRRRDKIMFETVSNEGSSDESSGPRRSKRPRKETKRFDPS